MGRSVINRRAINRPLQPKKKREFRIPDTRVYRGKQYHIHETEYGPIYYLTKQATNYNVRKLRKKGWMVHTKKFSNGKETITAIYKRKKLKILLKSR